MKHKGGELLVLQLIKLSHLRPFGGFFAVSYVDDGVVGHNFQCFCALSGTTSYTSTFPMAYECRVSQSKLVGIADRACRHQAMRCGCVLRKRCLNRSQRGLICHRIAGPVEEVLGTIPNLAEVFLVDVL